MSDLYKKYPKYKNKKGIELESFRICPLGVESDHEDINIKINEKMAEKLISEIELTPLVYGNTLEGLPINHGKKDNDEYEDRRVIGTGLGGSITTDENGTKWLIGDYILYSDTNKKVIDKLKEFKNDLSASYEIRDARYDDDGNIVYGDYKATALMDKDYSAYHHKALLVAEKSKVKEDSVDNEVKDLLQKIYDMMTINTKISVDEAKKELEEEIKDTEQDVKRAKEDVKYAEKQKSNKVEMVQPDNTYWENYKKESEKRIKEKEEELDKLKTEIKNLRELTNGFTNLK